ncbi:MAG: glycosyltransferase [Deltaproteobacteria bacterium]|nr:glycosyltransferase [Deltaproteobacteria bacterium]
MKIALISRSNAIGGGASRVSEDLACWLNNVPGIIAHLWVDWPGKHPAPYHRWLSGNKWLYLILRCCRVLSRRVGLPDFLTPELIFFKLTKKDHYDLYHFHDISETFSPLAMRWIARRAPAVWTFHDSSPFTGGCLSTMECTAYRTVCRNCPQLHRRHLMTSIDFTGAMQSYKRKTAQAGLITPVTPSRWMADQAIESRMFSIPPVVIPNGIDTDLFRPYDKRQVRMQLGLPQDEFIVLISANYLTEERKGGQYALDAINSCQRRVFILAVGNGGDSVTRRLPDRPAANTGFIGDLNKLSMYYAAADVFLFPSLVENCPLSILETMACGTPAITFRSGGVPELVTHRETGWIVEPKDTAGLTAGLQFCYDNSETLAEWARAGREKAESYDSRTVINHYLKLYQEVVSEKGKRR